MAKVDRGAREAAGGRRGRLSFVLFLLLSICAAQAVAGETRCWLDRGAVVVPAAFGDIAGDFILDLAGPSSALHDTRANADGLTGPSATAPLRVAGAALGETTLPIVDLDAETAPFATSINGILGSDVTRGRILTLDFRKGRCRLTLGRAARTVRRTADVQLGVVWTGGVPAVRALTSDGVRTRAGLFALGTARAATVVVRARLSRKADGEAPVRLRAVELGGRLFEQVPADIGPAPAEGLAGAIGTAVLSHGRLMLDGRRGLLILQWPTLRQMDR
jgi:hypothetical protein